MINKIYECTDEQFVNLIKNSANIAEVLFKLGYTMKGNSWGYSQVKQRMTDLNLSSANFKGKNAYYETNKEREISPDKLFRINCKHTRTVLRRNIIRNNLLPYKCAICGISKWNNKTLSLELDHINGMNNDNRLENLRFLCPNCHSQTTTYGSRNQQRNESTYEITDELRELVSNTYDKVNSVKRVSSILGIRRKVVTAIVNETGQKHSNQKYVIRYDKNHNEIARYGSLVEAAKTLIANNEVKTKKVKTCTRTISYNKDNFWLNSYWTILDGSGINDNPLLESSLIDSENLKVDEAQAKAA
jgi:transposase-like protein